ncbi:hypothetical protein [Sphingomonas psychrotolerans]|uniref:hypothetical protein n=1 Tax=Sphingomonas psychrotolerans TaxID=1327635 RepID=UPI0013051287|nr:hypothetical protein [Sphingomonas psychrotolerans]
MPVPSSKGRLIPPSSILCRAQEALQRARAAASTLDSVRIQAEAAAAAWAKEAVAAEHRERRKLRVIATRDAELATAAQDTRIFSENPDRGLASA